MATQNNNNTKMTRLLILSAWIMMMPLATLAFQPVSRKHTTRLWNLHNTMAAAASSSSPEDPQVLATGYSQAMELKDAIQEATDMALRALPKYEKEDSNDNQKKIDLAIISISSLYDGNSSPSEVVPTILEAASKYGQGIQHLVGSTSGGFVSSKANLEKQLHFMQGDGDEKEAVLRSCLPVEREGVPGVSVMFCVLPDVHLKVSN
jgi:hypothetical protein